MSMPVDINITTRFRGKCDGQRVDSQGRLHFANFSGTASTPEIIDNLAGLKIDDTKMTKTKQVNVKKEEPTVVTKAKKAPVKVKKEPTGMKTRRDGKTNKAAVLVDSSLDTSGDEPLFGPPKAKYNKDDSSEEEDNYLSQQIRGLQPHPIALCGSAY
jgi:hypothetical protein